MSPLAIASVRKQLICLLLLMTSTAATAQKVKVGYDKSTDFSKFTSYTWAEPDTPPARPFLYANIIGAVDYELKAKALRNAAKDGDLILVPSGDMEFGLNTAGTTPMAPALNVPPPSVNATMWTGSAEFSQLTAMYVPEGTLVLTFIDRAANKVVWTGAVTEKLEVEHKIKSLERVNKAIAKLLKQFPPKQK